jgi:uncharacterized membrane protein YbhN (UPF0104 family)
VEPSELGPPRGVPAGEPGWRHALRQALPYLLGAVMFGIAVWVLHRTLGRYDLADLHAELAGFTGRQLGLAVLFTALSFAALVGYEYSALRLIGRPMPLRKLALASFCTQSIAHSTGFAFVVGASLRYRFYADRGITLVDVAKIQLLFTVTFALGVATLAGGVLLLEPSRLAAITGMPDWLWRTGAVLGLVLVAAYLAWGALFHHPIRVRGRTFSLPPVRSTLLQIFFGVADLLAVAAALHVLLPASLGLSYVEVLAIFMASIIAGLVSHVPGSLGVFESAVLLLVQPAEGQTLPLIGALLAFRACYYLLPLTCGVLLLTCYELTRWRHIIARSAMSRLAPRLRPWAPPVAAALTALAGTLLLLATATPIPEARAARLAAAMPPAFLGFSGVVSSGLGVGLLVLARGMALRVAQAWGWGIVILAVGTALCLVTAERPIVWMPLVLALAVLVVARHEFVRTRPRLGAWMTPAWLALCAAGIVLAAVFLARG